MGAPLRPAVALLVAGAIALGCGESPVPNDPTEGTSASSDGKTPHPTSAGQSPDKPLDGGGTPKPGQSLPAQPPVDAEGLTKKKTGAPTDEEAAASEPVKASNPQADAKPNSNVALLAIGPSVLPSPKALFSNEAAPPKVSRLLKPAPPDSAAGEDSQALTVHWRTPVTFPGGGSRAIVVHGSNRVVIAGTKATHGLQRSDGKLIWSLPTGADAATVVDNRLVLENPTRVLSISSGDTLWTAPAGGGTDCGAVVGGNYLAFYDITGEDDFEREEDWSDGETRDSVVTYSLKNFRRRADVSGIVGKMRCPTGGPLGFFVGQHFVSGRANKLAWSNAWEGASIDDQRPLRDIQSQRQLIAIRGQAPMRVEAFHANDGAPQWTQPLPAGVTVQRAAVALDDVVVVTGTTASGADKRSFVYGLRRDTGQALWWRILPHRNWLLAPSREGLLMADDGSLHILHPATGDLVWTASLDGKITGMVARKSRVYLVVSGVATDSGTAAVAVALSPTLPEGHSAALPAIPGIEWTNAGTDDHKGSGPCGDTASPSKVAPAAIAARRDGGALVVGNSAHAADARLVSVDADGTAAWDATYLGGGADAFKHVYAQPDGNVVLVGTTRSRTPDDEAVHLVGLGQGLKPVWEQLAHGGVGSRGVPVAHMGSDGTLSLGIQTDRKGVVARHDTDGKLRWTKRLPRQRDRFLAIRGLKDGSIEVLVSGPAPRKGRRGVRYQLGYKKPRRTTSYAKAAAPIAAAFDLDPNANPPSDKTDAPGPDAAANIWWVGPASDNKGWLVRLANEDDTALTTAVLKGATGSVVGTHVDATGLYLLERQQGPPGMLWHIPRNGEPTRVAVPSIAIPDAWTPDGQGFRIVGHDSAKRLRIVRIDRDGRLNCPSNPTATP